MIKMKEGEMTDLKPCLRCGHAPSLEVKSYPEDGQTWFRIFCRSCQVCSPYEVTEEKARATWNSYDLPPCPVCGKVPKIWMDWNGYSLGCRTGGCPNINAIEDSEFDDLFTSWRRIVEETVIPEENCMNCWHHAADHEEFPCIRLKRRFKIPHNLACPAWYDINSEEPPAPAPCPVCGSSDVLFVSAIEGPSLPGGITGQWICGACEIRLTDDDLGIKWAALMRRRVDQ